MSVDLYHMELSPPSRAVRLTAKAIELELNLIEVNLMAGENLKPEFLKLNPQHTVPTMVDGDLSLAESRAQMCYLVNKYGGEDNKLYPKCPKKRAQVDRYLYFDAGSLYGSFAAYFYPQLMVKETPNPEKAQKVNDNLKFLETFLGDNKYLLGDDITLADLSIAASLSMFEVAEIDMTNFGKVTAYYNRLKELPYWHEVNDIGMESARGWVKAAKQPK